nr:protein regulator of cytokinesis 1 isoform X2 [Columba livia]
MSASGWPILSRGSERWRRAGSWLREGRAGSPAGSRSEVLAAGAVSCQNRAMAALRDIWEEIGIPEELRLECSEVLMRRRFPLQLVKQPGSVPFLWYRRGQEEPNTRARPTA